MVILSTGIKVELIDKIGMHCSDTTTIYLEDVRVPASNIVGQEGMGFIYQMMQFQEERLYAGAAGKDLYTHAHSGLYHVYSS